MVCGRLKVNKKGYRMNEKSDFTSSSLKKRDHYLTQEKEASISFKLTDKIEVELHEISERYKITRSLTILIDP